MINKKAHEEYIFGIFFPQFLIGNMNKKHMLYIFRSKMSLIRPKTIRFAVHQKKKKKKDLKQSVAQTQNLREKKEKQMTLV